MYTMSSDIRLTGVQPLIGNLSFNDDSFAFSGAKPSQVGYLSTVTSNNSNPNNRIVGLQCVRPSVTVLQPSTTSCLVVAILSLVEMSILVAQ